MYNLSFWIWLIISVGIIAGGLILIFKNKPSKQFMFFMMTIASTVSLIIVMLCNINVTGLTGIMSPKGLPFTFSGIQIVFIYFCLLGKEGKLKNFIYNLMIPTCLIGGIVGIFIPVVGSSFASLISYQNFIYNSLLVILGVYLIIYNWERLNYKCYLSSLLGFGGLYVFGIMFNAVVGQNSGANFFATAGPILSNLPLLNLNHGWGLYFMWLIIFTIIGAAIVYIPIFIKNIKSYNDKKKNRFVEKPKPKPSVKV